MAEIPGPAGSDLEIAPLWGDFADNAMSVAGEVDERRLSMNTQYKGFDITLTAGDQWAARITRIATGKAFSQPATAPLEAGADAALSRARNIVDAFLALNGR